MQRLLCCPDLYRIDLDVKLVSIFFKLTLLHRKINTLGIEKQTFLVTDFKNESKICKVLSFHSKIASLLQISLLFLVFP